MLRKNADEASDGSRAGDIDTEYELIAETMNYLAIVHIVKQLLLKRGLCVLLILMNYVNMNNRKIIFNVI